MHLIITSFFLHEISNVTLQNEQSSDVGYLIAEQQN